MWNGAPVRCCSRPSSGWASRPWVYYRLGMMWIRPVKLDGSKCTLRLWRVPVVRKDTIAWRYCANCRCRCLPNDPVSAASAAARFCRASAELGAMALSKSSRRVKTIARLLWASAWLGHKSRPMVYASPIEGGERLIWPPSFRRPTRCMALARVWRSEITLRQ